MMTPTWGLFISGGQCVNFKSDYYQHPGLAVTGNETLFQHLDKLQA